MFRIQVDSSRARSWLNTIVDIFRKSSEDETQETMGKIQREMKEPGRPVTYPIQWDSEKQRRFVIMKLKAENNLPYRRTGRYNNGWAITKITNGLTLSNKHPAGAIGGTLNSRPSRLAIGGASFQSWQSRIHRGRWKMLLPTVLQALIDMPKRVLQRIKVSANA